MTSASTSRTSDALKVAHHGSADPGLPALLARVAPRRSRSSPSARTPTAIPHPATLRALRAVPEVHRTDRDGTVRLRVRAGRMQIEASG